MTMCKVIKPTIISDAMLTSSTAPENDYAEWNAATAYTAGNLVIRTATHRIYERLIGGTTATAPESDVTNWLDVGPTNRWAMLDDVVGTQTSIVTPLTVVLRPGRISGIALMELEGRNASVVMKDAPGGTVVYSENINLDDTEIDSFYDWFFEPYKQKTDVILTALPDQFYDGELTVEITSTGGSTVKCGVCKVGEVIEIGDTLSGATVGITDYSKKEADDWGRYSIVRRSWSKRATIQVMLESRFFARVFKALAALRATPCVWITTDDAYYSPLLIYGFFKNFAIDIPYPNFELCSIDIEGLI